MRCKAHVSFLLIVLFTLSPTHLVFGGETEHLDQMMTRMLGFHYPLDAGGGYKVGWVGTWDAIEVENDLQKIRNNFPDVNLLRIPIAWYEMNETLLLTHMSELIAFGRTYDFKFMFIIMDALGGTPQNLTPENYLPTNWTDHEDRITDVVNHFKNEDQIYAWALENEANVFQEIVFEWYEHFIPFVKALDSDTPLCTSFYFLGSNSTTLPQSSELCALGLDFIEFHWYPTNTTNISAFIDEISSSVQKPLFISEFGVYNGLNTYDVNTNKQILQTQLEEFEKRLNVIGVSYFLWSDDDASFPFTDYSIWNSTSQSPRPEATTINTYGDAFLEEYPYAYLTKLESMDDVTSHSIYDPSFQTLIEYPETQGWAPWNNNTSYDLLNVTTGTTAIADYQNISAPNLDFEYDKTYWEFWPVAHAGNEQWEIVTSPVYYGEKALKMWANETATDPGWALKLDGINDYGEIPNADSIYNFTEITVECWINATTLQDGVNWRNIINKGWNTEGSFVMYLDKDTLNLFWGLQLNGSSRLVDTDTGMTLNSWYHIVGTYDGTTIRLYRDGVAQTPLAYSWPSFSNTANLIIGGSTNDFNGTIDEIRIYNRAINSTEITHSYNSGVGEARPLNETGIVAWYQFGGAGSIIYDGTANHNYGGLHGGERVDGRVPVHLDDTQVLHNFATIDPKYAYVFDGHVKLDETTNGGYAFISISFQDSYGWWTHYIDSEYVDETTGWVRVYVTAIAPPQDAVAMQILCRTRATTAGQNITLAYFDHLTLRKIAPCSYDGRSFMLGWAKGWNDTLLMDNAVQLSQNYTFPDPTKDVRKTWTFSCKIAVVQSEEYVTDWKGCFIELAFTTDDPNTWLTWYDSEYLSFNNQFTTLTVSALPPSNAKGLQMLIKTSRGYWGVMFIDNAQLTSPSNGIVTPKNFAISGLKGIKISYTLTLWLEANNQTSFKGYLYCGTEMRIVEATCSHTTDTFWSTFEDTTEMVITFTIGSYLLEPLFPLMLVMGLVGLLAMHIGPLYTINEWRKKNWYNGFVYGLIITVVGLALFISWLWG